MAQPKSSKKATSHRTYTSVPQKIALRHIPAMPIETHYTPADIVVAHERKNDSSVFRYREPKTYKPIREWFVSMDVHSLREEFLTVQTAAEAHSWLAVAGVLRRTRHKNGWSVLSWEEFQIWQRIVRRIILEGFPQLGLYDQEMSTPPPFTVGETVAFAAQLRNVSESTFYWLKGMGDGLQIEAEPTARKDGVKRQLKATITVVTALEAMLASIYMDSLQGVEYRLCELDVCNRLYEVTSSHPRKYCNQYCAHKASIRRQRADTRAAKEKALARESASAR